LDEQGIEATYLFDIPSVGEDFVVRGTKLVGPRLEYFHDDVRSFPRQRELVAAFIALDALEHQIPNVESSVVDATSMVLA
jgi:hypothetical protein